MTVASEISRLSGAKDCIKASIENKGVSVPSDVKIDIYSTYIDQIETIDDTPAGITGSQVYGGIYSVGSNQDIGSLSGCVSYATDDLVLIGYMGSRQTYDNYDQKDVHFLRWKKGETARKGTSLDMGTGTTYSFFNEGIYITKENDGASYLFTAKARYITDGTNDWWYRGQIRYTVSNDTFTSLGSTNVSSKTDPWLGIVNDDMMLYRSSYEISRESRVALFTLKDT